MGLPWLAPPRWLAPLLVARGDGTAIRGIRQQTGTAERHIWQKGALKKGETLQRRAVLVNETQLHGGDVHRWVANVNGHFTVAIKLADEDAHVLVLVESTSLATRSCRLWCRSGIG